MLTYFDWIFFQKNVKNLTRINWNRWCNWVVWGHVCFPLQKQKFLYNSTEWSFRSCSGSTKQYLYNMIQSKYPSVECLFDMKRSEMQVRYLTLFPMISKLINRTHFKLNGIFKQIIVCSALSFGFWFPLPWTAHSRLYSVRVHVKFLLLFDIVKWMVEVFHAKHFSLVWFFTDSVYLFDGFVYFVVSV